VRLEERLGWGNVGTRGPRRTVVDKKEKFFSRSGKEREGGHPKKETPQDMKQEGLRRTFRIFAGAGGEKGRGRGLSHKGGTVEKG